MTRKWAAVLVAILLIAASGYFIFSRGTRSSSVAIRDTVPACPMTGTSSSRSGVTYPEETNSSTEVLLADGSVVGTLRGGAVVDKIRQALQAGEPVDLKDIPEWHPDVRLVLHQKVSGAVITVQWRSGTVWFRVVPNDGVHAPVALRVPNECVPPVAQAVNTAMAGDCKVSPIVHSFADVGMGRHDGAVWAADNGQLWRAGDTIKVVWRIASPQGEPVFTLKSADGRSGDPIHPGLHTGNTTQTLAEYGGNLKVPDPGCWTISVKAGSATGAITVRVF